MSINVARALFLGAAVVTAGVVLATAASAQFRNDVLSRVNRLELDLQEIQRRLFAPGEPTAPAPAGAANPAAPDNWAPRAEVRLQQLESQIRTLTGQVEEFRFALSEAVARLDDIAARLQPPATDQQPPDSQPDEPEDAPVAPAADPQATASAGEPPAAVAPAADGAQQEAAAAPVDTQVQYEQAFALLMRHDYAAAEAAFRAFVEANGDDPLAGNAMYWLGETHYVREQFSEAASAFAAGYEKYAGSPKTPDNLLKLGLSLANLHRNDDACVAFAQFHHQFPDAAATLKRRARAEETRLNCPG